jgi:hypothetical protein
MARRRTFESSTDVVEYVRAFEEGINRNRRGDAWPSLYVHQTRIFEHEVERIPAGIDSSHLPARHLGIIEQAGIRGPARVSGQALLCVAKL